MNGKTTCLYPGRFQPLHKGHAAIISDLASRYDHVIVAISCAHLSHTLADPFTGGERFQMIKAYLTSEHLSEAVDVIPVPTDPFPTTWVPFIRSIAPPFQVVHARNPLIRTIFCHWGCEIDDKTFDRHVSGTHVREWMVSDQNWKDLVPAAVADLILQLAGVERLKQLALGNNI